MHRPEDYPFIENFTTFKENPHWMYFECEGHSPPDHLRFSVCTRPGWVDWEAGTWDLPRIGPYPVGSVRLFGGRDEYDEESAALAKVADLVPDEYKASIEIFRTLPYDRIIAVDEIGDAFNEGPHLLVEWHERSGLFGPDWDIHATGPDQRTLWLDPSRQLTFFPREKA